MAKLTEAQRHALTYISETPRKSGRFWRDLGISPQTIANLERDGFVGAVWRPSTGETTVLRRSWHATDAGRAALEQEERR